MKEEEQSMKIILNDFNYKGKHYDHFEMDIPDHVDINEVPAEKITEYVVECLDLYAE